MGRETSISSKSQGQLPQELGGTLPGNAVGDASSRLGATFSPLTEELVTCLVEDKSPFQRTGQPRPSGIYLRSARLVRHSKDNYHNPPVNRLGTGMSTDAEKAPDKVPRPLVMKNPSEAGMERNFLPVVKSLYS